MPPFHFRLTCDVADNARFCDFMLRNSSGKFLCVAEIGKREHIHCYLEFQMTKKSFMNKFNDKFKNIDRRDKYLDEDKGTTLQYICKGPNSKIKTDVVVVAKRALTDLDIVEMHEQFWKNKPQVHEVPITLTPVSEVLGIADVVKYKPKRAPPFLRGVYDELDAMREEDDWTFGVADKQIIFKFLMMRLGQGVKTLDKIIITRMVNGLQNALISSKKQLYEHWWYECFPNDPSLNMGDLIHDNSLV